MNSSKVIGAGAFVVIGALLFTTALFMIGERRMLFQQRFTLYTEYATLGQLQSGAVVRVSGLDAGEVTELQIPASPSQKFRVKMLVREDLHHLIRADSVATTQTEGLVGAVFVDIGGGTDQAPVVPENGTVPSREPFQLSDLMQQASDTVMLITDTVTSLRGDLETAVKQIALTSEDAHAMVADIRPDLTAMARNGTQISAETRDIIASINNGKGTIGKLVNDDTLYQRAREIADQTQAVMASVRQVSDETRKAIADVRSPEGPAQGLLADMRTTMVQAREATADLADNMEALKRNFLLRGFFNRRGYYDLDAISPADYRNGVLENGKRKAMRIWLGDAVLFEAAPTGGDVLTADGRARIDSAMATYLRYVPANPIVVEGYSTVGTTGERYSRSRAHAALVREYVLGRYQLMPQNIGAIALAEDAKGSPSGDGWDGVAITLFLDRESLQFAGQATGAR
jgi:phospholipid/cholesterol/gamma-HCH transport system substrate-binding protein